MVATQTIPRVTEKGSCALCTTDGIVTCSKKTISLHGCPCRKTGSPAGTCDMRSSTRILQAVSKWHAKSWLRSFIFPTDFSAMDRRAYTTGKIARQACNGQHAPTTDSMRMRQPLDNTAQWALRRPMQADPRCNVGPVSSTKSWVAATALSDVHRRPRRWAADQSVITYQ